MIRKMTAHKGLAFATLALVLGAATVVLGLAFAQDPRIRASRSRCRP